jgi:K+-transporting ATPase B subunit
LSHFSQMVGLTTQNFLSAASGMAAAAAVARGFAARQSPTIGNFWQDLTRIVLYILLPLAVVFALVLLASGLLLFVILTVFLAGLMVGRTPEYLGKKIEAREIKLAALTLLIMPVGILGFSALAIATGAAQASVQDAGPHGLSELIYAYTSATGNNGSAFAGFTANTAFHNTMLAVAMLLGRFGYILPILAIAGSLAAKTPAAPTAGTFPTHGPVFVVLLVMTILIVGALPFFASWSGTTLPVIYLAALFVTLIPTTIGGLLSAIGIAGMDRLVKANVIAKSGRAVEAAGDIDVLLLDKTGTITFGNRMAAAFVAVGGASEREVAEAAYLSSLADETAEGRSIVELGQKLFGLAPGAESGTFVPFTAQTRMSGVDLPAKGSSAGEQIRKGAADSVVRWLRRPATADLDAAVKQIAKAGGTPLVVARGERALGVIYLKDIVKPGIRERFAELRRMGIRTVMITGDNPLTAAAIAAEAGVDDFLAEATPEAKLALIRKEQAEGRLVAICGDGSNDAPALAQADVGVAMNSGTPAAKEAGNLIDLDSDPTKLIEIVLVGKQLLISRGALTTFSIANDVAKYFAILPALFVAAYPGLGALNVMGLASPESAILSAIIFNALVIVALIPIADG